MKAERRISDHELIYGKVPGAVKKQQNVQIVRCWSRCDINAVMSDLEAAPWSAMESFDDIDDIVGGTGSPYFPYLGFTSPTKEGPHEESNLTRD